MSYDNKIVVSMYDNDRPCVSVETPDGGSFILTADTDQAVPIDIPWDDTSSKDANKTLLDTPMLESIDDNLYKPIENIIYRRTGDVVEVEDCGRCLMEVIEVLVEEGEYLLKDNEYLLKDKLVKLD